MKKFIIPVLLTIIAIGLFFFFQQVNQRVYVVEGQILGFSDSESTVFINHEEIPGYMDAMAMPFNVKNIDELEELSIGDAIRFSFYITPDGSWIQDLESIPDSLLSLAATPPFGDVHANPAQEIIKVGEAVSPFVMTDQNGNAFTSESLQGRYTIMTFIYTSCPVPDFCPLMSQNLDGISKLLTENEHSQVQLVSVTFDPQNDTPDVLKAYSNEHEQRANRFYIVGDSTQTSVLTSQFGIFTTFATDQIIHNLQTAIIGPDGRVLEMFSGNKWAVDDLLAALREHLN